MLDHRKILILALRFLGVFLVCLLLFPTVAPRYRRLVVASANSIVSGFSPPVEIEVMAGGDLRYVERSPDGRRSQIATFLDGGATYLGLNVILLPGLILATPSPLTRRLRLLAIGLVLLMAVHVGTAAAWAKVAACVADRPGFFPCEWSFYLLVTSGSFGSVAIWGLVTWRDLLFRSRPPGRVGRNARCPCGSGRKHKRCCGRTGTRAAMA